MRRVTYPSRDTDLASLFKRSFYAIIVLSPLLPPISPQRDPRSSVMESLCIICLNSLPSAETSYDGGNIDESSEHRTVSDGTKETAEATPPSLNSTLRGDVAHLQNCRHIFHDHCIAVWIEV